MWYKKSQNIMAIPPRLFSRIYSLYKELLLEDLKENKTFTYKVPINLDGWKYDKSLVTRAKFASVWHPNMTDEEIDNISNTEIAGFDYLNVEFITTPAGRSGERASWIEKTATIKIYINISFVIGGSSNIYNSMIADAIRHELIHWVQYILSYHSVTNASISKRISDNAQLGYGPDYGNKDDNYIMSDKEFHPHIESLYRDFVRQLDSYEKYEDKLVVFKHLVNNSRTLDTWKYYNEDKYNKAIKILSRAIHDSYEKSKAK